MHPQALSSRIILSIFFSLRGVWNLRWGSVLAGCSCRGLSRLSQSRLLFCRFASALHLSSLVMDRASDSSLLGRVLSRPCLCLLSLPCITSHCTLGISFHCNLHRSLGFLGDRSKQQLLDACRASFPKHHAVQLPCRCKYSQAPCCTYCCNENNMCSTL